MKIIVNVCKLNLKEYKLLIDAKSKIFYSTTTESFGNRIERSRAMLLRLVQLDHGGRRALQRGPGGPWPTKNFGWVGHNAFGPTNNWPVGLCSLV